MNKIRLNEVATVIKFSPETSIKKITLDPLILISVVKLGESCKKPKDEIIKNYYYNNYHIKKVTKNFFESFNINISNDLKTFNYKDIDIWQCQFEEKNQLFLVKDNNIFYIMHISFLSNFHKKNLEMSIKMNLSILNYTQTLNKFEKDILIRNSKKKIFQFCSENSLVCKWEIDKKAKPIVNKVNPFLALLDHFEFLNDLKCFNNLIYYFNNCSIHDENVKGHVKLYSDSKNHLIMDLIPEDENDEKKLKSLYAYLNITGKISDKRPDSLYKKAIIKNPHIVYNVSESDLNFDLPNLKNVYKTKIILNSVQIYK